MGEWVMGEGDCLVFFVTATGTNVGKTFITLMLMEHFAKKGYKVGAFKPIETGVKSIPLDGEKLLEKSKELNADFYDINMDDTVPVTFKLPAAPFVAKKDKTIDFKKIDASFKKIKSKCDILFIEGAGGLLVPVEKNFFMMDFIKYFDAKALLVTHGRLGCINETLLSLKLLNDKKLPHKWCINLKESEKNDFLETTLPYYKSAFKNLVILPGDLETLEAQMIHFI